MYGVQTPVVSAPLTPKAHFNTYIWGRKFETYNSVHYSEYFDIIFVPCKFCQFEFVETRAKLKGYRNLNTRDRNIFQNERVEIANPCVLDSTGSD